MPPSSAGQADAPWSRRLDAAAVVLLVGVALAAWHHDATTTGLAPGAGAPAWSTARDGLLDGPDAGRWLWQAKALVAGERDRLDPHRMPTWTLLTVLVAGVTRYPLVLAGHLVNHLLGVVIGPVVYGLGRVYDLGRAPALAAGALVVLSPTWLESCRAFGVDPTVSFLWPAGLLLAALAGARPWLAPVAGALAAAVSAAHFTSIPAPIPLLVGLLAAAPAGTRLRATLGYTLGLGAALFTIYQVLPPVAPAALVLSVTGGIAPRHLDVADPYDPALAQGAWRAIEAGGRLAPQEAARWLIRATGLPGPVAAALFVLGGVGPGLGAPARARRRRARSAPLAGLAPAVAPVLALTPVLAMLVAQAPNRYLDNFAPLGVLLVLRGVASVGGALSRGLSGSNGAAALGAVAATAASVVARLDDMAPRRRLEPDLALKAAGERLAARIAPGDEVATVVPELAAYAGAYACAEPFVCPGEGPAFDPVRCMGIIERECAGEGPIPYVVAVSRPVDGRPALRVQVDAWVIERWPPAPLVTGAAWDIGVSAVPRRSTSP